MLWYFDLFSQKSWFSKTNNCSFCNKTTQDFAEFWEIWVNFKAKTKTEDEGILRKGKRSSSWFLSLRIGLAEREENQIFCHAKHANLLALLKYAYDDKHDDNNDKTHPPWIVVRVGMIFHRCQKETQKERQNNVREIDHFWGLKPWGLTFTMWSTLAYPHKQSSLLTDDRA